MMSRHLKQRAALFGLDARLTLIIAGIIGVLVAVNQHTRIQANRTEEAYNRMTAIQNAILERYEFDRTVVSNIETQLINIAGQYGQSFLPDTIYRRDPWGNNWQILSAIHAETGDITRFGQYVIIQYVLLSAGPNGTFDNTYLLSPGDFPSFEVSYAFGDDLFMKFTTVDIARRWNAETTERVAAIRQKLDAMAQHNRIRHQRYCPTVGTGAGQLCDLDNNGTYIAGEELAANFYPLGVEVFGGCVGVQPIYPDNNTYSRSFTSGNLASMRLLLDALGLPTAWATSPWGTILNYDSNVGNRCVAPFTIRIWYPD